MPFPDSIKQAAYERAGGRCECTRGHEGQMNVFHRGGRCPTNVPQSGGWEAHYVSAGGGDTLENCEVLCARCARNL
jgi:hypothetical protein